MRKAILILSLLILPLFVQAQTCTSGQQAILRANIAGAVNDLICVNAIATFIVSRTTSDLTLNTSSDNRQVELNSRDFNQVSGDSIGFRAVPTQATTSTGTLFGGQVTGRVNNDIDVANVIGLHHDVYLRGTTARTISGDVRGGQIELVTDDAGTSTISGNVTGLRMRAAFSATTLTGDMEAIRIEVAEAQTNSQQWDQVLTLTGAPAGIWNANPTTEPSTADGYIKVKVEGLVRYIQLYSTAPVD